MRKAPPRSVATVRCPCRFALVAVTCTFARTLPSPSTTRPLTVPVVCAWRRSEARKSANATAARFAIGPIFTSRLFSRCLAAARLARPVLAVGVPGQEVLDDPQLLSAASAVDREMPAIG